jgi:glycosyltransferase involved in cell wall biosynthesis
VEVRSWLFILNEKRIIMLLAKNSVKSDARVISEAKALLKNGYDVSVIAWDRKGVSKKSEEYESINIERIRLRTSFSNSSKLVFYLILFNIIAFFRLLSENFDIIHCHDLDTLFAGFFAGKLKSRKVIYDAHEIYPLMVQQHLPKIMVKMLCNVEFLLIKRVDILITVSEIFADYFEEGVGKKTKIFVVMNCKDPEDFRTSEKRIAEFKKRFGIENHFMVLYNGWLTPNNGLEELFNAIENLNSQIEDMIVVICGDGFASEEFKKVIKEKDIEKYVKFVGKIQWKHIPLFINACNIMYVVYNPADKYTFLRTPVRLFEAIAAGKPIIASNFGELGRIIKKEGCGVLVDPKNPNELSYALLELNRNKHLYEELCRNSKRASKTYNWVVMEERLIHLYKRLCPTP